MALLFRPWYFATASSIARSRSVAEKVLTFVFAMACFQEIYKTYIILILETRTDVKRVTFRAAARALHPAAAAGRF